jgi:hypothetical protein
MGNVGRNSLVGPRLVNFDMSLLKDNPVKHISETFNAHLGLQLRNKALPRIYALGQI